MPPEIVVEENYESAQKLIQTELNEKQKAEARFVAQSIADVVKLLGSCSESKAKRVLNTLTDNQLRFIILNSGCSNFRTGIVFDILNVQGRQQTDQLTREALLDAAVFTTTTEPGRQATVRFNN